MTATPRKITPEYCYHRAAQVLNQAQDMYPEEADAKMAQARIWTDLGRQIATDEAARRFEERSVAMMPALP